MFAITDWIAYYNDLSDVTVNSSREVEGLCKKSTGGRFLYAKINVSIQPSDELSFELDIDDKLKEIMINEGWLNSLCQGILDVMLVRPITPITKLKCVINKVDYHEIDSSRKAFQLAGRNAAEEFLKQELYNKI